MLSNMISMLASNDKQHWKVYLPTLVYAYNCTKNNAMDFSLYYLMYGYKPRLPIDIKFGLTSPKPKSILIINLWQGSAPNYASAISWPIDINTRSLPAISDSMTKR